MFNAQCSIKKDGGYLSVVKRDITIRKNALSQFKNNYLMDSRENYRKKESPRFLEGSALCFVKRLFFVG
jgi:hypothetical protein